MTVSHLIVPQEEGANPLQVVRSAVPITALSHFCPAGATNKAVTSLAVNDQTTTGSVVNKSARTTNLNLTFRRYK